MSATTIEAKEMFERRNTTDVFNRLIIAGVLSVLNKKLVYTQVWDDKEDKIEEITVPFFYDFGENFNSEKFIQDNYLFFGDNGCTEIGLKKIDGNFDFYPKGAVSMSSDTIDSGNITNRFVMGHYNKIVDGQLKAFVSYLYSIPLTYNFKVVVRCENMNTAFKIDEAFRMYFFKNKSFYVNYKGMRVPCRIGFPDSVGTEKGANYTMGASDADKYIKLNMDLAVETYQPVFDPTTELPEDCSISSLSNKFKMNGADSSDNVTFEMATDISGMTFASDYSIFLQWKYLSDYTDSISLDISWIDTSTNEETLIETVSNNNFYNWTTPVNPNAPVIDCIIENTDSVYVYKMPEIRIVPDVSTKVVRAEDIIVYKNGFFITNAKQVSGVLSYEDLKNVVIEIPFKFNILNNMIDMSNPIEMDSFVYNNDIACLKIDLVVADHHDKTKQVKMTNITII